MDPWSRKYHFYTLWIDINIRQKVKNECFGALCISGTLNIRKVPSDGRAEIKNIFDCTIFSVSALPPKGAFQMLRHFYHQNQAKRTMVV